MLCCSNVNNIVWLLLRILGLYLYRCYSNDLYGLDWDENWEGKGGVSRTISSVVTDDVEADKERCQVRGCLEIRLNYFVFR